MKKQPKMLTPRVEEKLHNILMEISKAHKISLNKLLIKMFTFCISNKEFRKQLEKSNPKQEESPYITPDWALQNIPNIGPMKVQEFSYCTCIHVNGLIWWDSRDTKNKTKEDALLLLKIIQ